MAKRCRGFSEIEERARRLRQSLGVDDLLTPDLIGVFARLPEIYPGFELVRVADEDLPDCEAKADCYEKRITVRESVYHACSSGDARARFTLAHELGHIVLGHAGTRLRSTALDQSYSTKDRRREEAEAWMFAEAFLAPTFLAVTCGSAEEICVKFGLSKEAADIRFDRLVPQMKKGVPPSARWKSEGVELAERSDGCLKKDRLADGSPRLPSSVVDFLTEARRRGHPVTSLRKSDEDQV